MKYLFKIILKQICIQINYDKTKPYLTGGLASGKSTVRKELEKFSVATIDCDQLGYFFNILFNILIKS